MERDQLLRSHLFLNKLDKDNLAVGRYLVTKTTKGFYNVSDKATKELLYRELYCFDSAMGIVEAMNAEKFRRVPEILEADDVLARNHLDMLRFAHRIEEGITSNESIAVFEDRYAVVKARAQNALTEIKRFRMITK